jgi:hypothetical protein
MLVLVIDYCSHDENLLRPEKLDVYREAINFCAWLSKFFAAVSAKAAAKGTSTN